MPLVFISPFLSCPPPLTLRHFWTPDPAFLLPGLNIEIQLQHDFPTIASLICLAFALLILYHSATYLVWETMSRIVPLAVSRPVPRSMFRRLCLPTLLYFPSIRDSLAHSQVFGVHMCQVFEVVATLWGFLTIGEKIAIIGPVVVLDFTWLMAAMADDVLEGKLPMRWYPYSQRHLSALDIYVQGKLVFDQALERELELPVQDGQQGVHEPAPEELQQPVQGLEFIRQREEPAMETPNPLEDIRQRLQCSVCLDVLRQPYVTSCGHVFDLVCLGKWVLNAPPLDRGLNPADPDYAWLRLKTCPCCRSVLFTPPIRLFFLDSLLDIIRDEDDDVNPTPVVENPANIWRGIFSPLHRQQPAPAPLHREPELAGPPHDPALPPHEPGPEPAPPHDEPGPLQEEPAPLHDDPSASR
ncbi:hypothetical protein B0H11DRAFT_2110214 [Mycena galericulata]|nr:hypothetical protein B0H11DRAFT_2110214 [Mycena galericulata]